MSAEKSPFEKPARSALAEGAARFDGLARELKARQIAENQGGTVSTDYVHAAVSPDEEWARNFMTQGIGPRLDIQPISAVMPSPAMPGVAFDFSPSPTRAVPQAAPETRGAIGTSLGKPAPRRSWLGRMLRPKSRGAE
ncbi:MAG: hypothetical protein ABSD74_16990 [Rhizomicrobium sp.]|jgi:hypothetical protein